MNVQTILIAALVFVAAIFMFGTWFYWKKYHAKQKKAFLLGGGQAKGEICQVLGTFAILGDYDQIITLATTSQQASLDVIGVKEDELVFIEFKKKGSQLKSSERKIKALIDEKKVRYLIKDVELPEGLVVSDKKLRARTVRAS